MMRRRRPADRQRRRGGFGSAALSVFGSGLLALGGATSQSACTRFGFGFGSGERRDAAGGGDAVHLDGRLADGGTTTCAVWGPFSQPVRVLELNSAGDDWVDYVNEAETEVYLDRFVGAGRDAYRAVRASPDAPFSSPLPLSSLNTVYDESARYVGRTGTLYLSTNRPGGLGNYDIWVAAPTQASAGWTVVGPLANVNSDMMDGGSWLSVDGLRLYLHSRRDGNGIADLWLAQRQTTADDFGQPAQPDGVNSTDHDDHPWLSADERELFFSSTRPPGQSGDRNIWRTTRASRSVAFSPPSLVTELNSTRDDGRPVLVRGGAVLYYNYDSVFAGGANSEIWRAERPCLAR